MKNTFPHLRLLTFLLGLLFSLQLQASVDGGLNEMIEDDTIRIYSFDFNVPVACVSFCASIDVDFTLAVDTFRRPDELPDTLIPYLEILFDYGDGTYYHDSISIGTYSSRTIVSPTFRVDESVSVVAEKLVLRHRHTYRGKPEHAPRVYLSAIYTDNDPPPLGRMADDRETNFFDELDGLSEIQPKINSGPYADTVNSITFHLNHPPVPNENLVGWLTYRDTMRELLESGTLLFFYNLPDYLETEFEYDLDSLREYFGEIADAVTYADFLSETVTAVESAGAPAEVNLPDDHFGNVIKIKFDSLMGWEERAILLPTFFPDDAKVDTTKEVVFVSVFIRGEDDLRALLEANSLYDFKESGGVTLGSTGGVPLPESQDDSGIRRRLKIEGIGFITREESPKRRTYGPSQETEGLFGYHFLSTKVKSAIDPNDISVSPTCFSKKKTDLFVTVDFMNEGNAPAYLVTIDLYMDMDKIEDQIELVNHSAGDIRIEKLNALPPGGQTKNGQNPTHRIVIDNLYLAPKDDQGGRNFGHVTFRAKTKNISSGDVLEFFANIQFENLGWFQVPDPALSRFGSGSGCEPKRSIIPLPITGMRAGVQYPLQYGNLEFSSFGDNFFYGIYWDPLRLGQKGRLRLEFNISNIGMMHNDGDTYRVRGWDASLQLRTQLTDRLTGGIGGGLFNRSKVFENDMEVSFIGSDFNKRTYFGLADLNLYLTDINFWVFNLKLFLGGRVNAFFEPTIAGEQESVLWAPQVYLNVGF